MASLPPPRVAAALTASASTSVASHSLGPGSAVSLAASGGGGSSIRGGADATDAGLLERLEWVQGWVRGAAAGDSDETCRMMAEACVNIQAGVAKAALESLHNSNGQLPPGPTSGGLVLPGANGWGVTGVKMPSKTGLNSNAPLLVSINSPNK